MNGSFLLINTNVSKPPVSPVGTEYVGETLVEAGVSVRLLDFSFVADWKAALARELEEEPVLVGLTVRNMDDCSFATRKSFLPWIVEIVTELRQLTKAFILLGGVGYSIMPEAILSPWPIYRNPFFPVQIICNDLVVPCSVNLRLP